MKINKKALIGIGAGLASAAIGACCLFKKKNDDEDYVVTEIDDGDVDEDESVESEED